jgi:type I restriction enzyme S subunit
MAGYVSGVAIPRIVLKDFRKFLIIVPSIDIQSQFFNLAEPMIGNCYRIIEKNVNLRRTRDLLLPKLISGEMNVEDLKINV